MEFLGEDTTDRFFDPGKSMRFLMENLDEVQRMFDSPSFEIVARQLNQRRLCRQDRLLVDGRRGLKNGN